MVGRLPTALAPIPNKQTNKDYSQAGILLGALGKNLFPHLLQLLEASCVSWLGASFLSFLPIRLLFFLEVLDSQ